MEQPAPFEHRLRVAPEGPGVYIMKDARGGVLYVGKASSLRNRVRSYFGSPAGLPPKIQRMVSKVSDFDFIVTNSEAEALILECNLIKRFRPPYNARLKDDKNYPYIKIDLKEDFPLVYITRKVLLDGARYFGPFATAWSVRRTLDLLKKLFPYRSCTRSITGKDPRPCLDYYIHRCVGPCIGAASKEEYRQVIQQVIQFLEGRTEGVVEELRRSMLEAAERQEFERAAVLRDQVQAIQRVTQEQQIRVSFIPQTDLDAVAMTSGKDQSWVEAFFIRQGKLVGRDHFMMEGTQDDTPGAILAEFVKQFYDSASYIPPQILLQHPLEEQALIRQWLRERRGGPIQLRAPQRGSLRRLVDMVAQNAVQGLEQMRVKWLGNASALEQALEELQEALNLPRPPQRIECYDISNIQGTSPVGSMVVFEGGRPKPAHYRRFQVRGVPGINDYAMMHEVLRRRFKRLGTLRPFDPAPAGLRAPQAQGAALSQSKGTAKMEAWGIVPDLVLIDGGKGHLSSALEVFLELGIDSVPLASITKENEWLYLPHTPEPTVLPRGSQGLFLVQRVRDEAHRFAITYHRKLRSRRSLASPIDTVPGVGPKRKRLLLRRFGTLKGIKEASLDEIAAVPGMTRSLAQRLKELL